MYAGFSKQINKAVSVEASVAAEQYHSPVWDKWRVYPTLNALWNVNDNHLLNLSFSSDSEFPSYWSTMSNVFYASAYHLTHGSLNYKIVVYYLSFVLYSLGETPSSLRTYFPQKERLSNSV